MDLSAHFKPLKFAENDFLEVLLNCFSLKRYGDGTLLEVEFDENTPAITLREEKHDLLSKIPDFKEKVDKYQKRLDSFLITQQGKTEEFSDPDFPFRYSSGGTLPILKMGGQEYYCLFYRDIFPVGWNIANGASDSQKELLNPLDTIERELREELIIFDPENRIRYVFEGDAEKKLDRPEFSVARRLWQERFRDKDFPNFQVMEVPLKWIEGPDAVKIRFGKEEPKKITGCFLNINAADFGIEIDKIARINLNEKTILCDGEIIQNRLVNRPVGLFRVTEMDRQVKENKTEFKPDFLFFGAKGYRGQELERIIEECLAEIAPIRTEQEINQWKGAFQKYDLCPVTRRIIKRYLLLKGEVLRTVPEHYDIFISFGSEDEEFADRVYQFLQRSGKKAFFCKETLKGTSGWFRELDHALDSAQCLLVIATNPDHIEKSWPEYEWRSFFMDIQCGKKPKTARVVSFIGGFDYKNLPRPLYFHQILEFDPDRFDIGLNKLSEYIP